MEALEVFVLTEGVRRRRRICVFELGVSHVEHASQLLSQVHEDVGGLGLGQVRHVMLHEGNKFIFGSEAVGDACMEVAGDVFIVCV